MQSVEELTAAVTREARNKAILDRVRYWLEHATDYAVTEMPTTRTCTAHIGNHNSNQEADGGLKIEIICKGFETGHEPKVRLVDREKWTVSAPIEKMHS
jgi:hypothetical protein